MTGRCFSSRLHHAPDRRTGTSNATLIKVLRINRRDDRAARPRSGTWLQGREFGSQHRQLFLLVRNVIDLSLQF